jgi:predicted alpha/beta hydrolase family esterase
MNRVVILHGNGGTRGTDNWYPYIKEGLEKLGIVCEAPNLPDSKLARKKYWFPYLKDVLKIGPDDLVVGRSSGSIAILRYAEQNQIGASVLVAAYYSDLGFESERKSGYFDAPWQWNKIKAHQKWTAIFASTDDPWIPIREPEHIAKKLGSTLVKFNNMGHFGGIGQPEKIEFPELLDFIKERLQSKKS